MNEVLQLATYHVFMVIISYSFIKRKRRKILWVQGADTLELIGKKESKDGRRGSMLWIKLGMDQL